MTAARARHAVRFLFASAIAGPARPHGNQTVRRSTSERGALMPLFSSVLFVLACTAAAPRNVSGYPPGNPVTYHERLAGVWLPSVLGQGGNAPITFKLKIVLDVAFGNTFSGMFRCKPNQLAPCPARFGKLTNITLRERATRSPGIFALRL